MRVQTAYRQLFYLIILMLLFANKQLILKQQPKPFKQLYPLQHRIKRRLNYHNKYPQDICALVVVEGLSQFNSQGPNYYIYGVHNKFSVMILMEYIRSKMDKLHQKQSFYIKVRNQVVKTTCNMGYLHKKYADEDGFLYVQINKESIF